MRRLLTAALALSLLGGTAALAQPYDQHRDDHGGYDQQRHDQHNGQAYGQRHDQEDQRRHWNRGERLPATYYRDRGHYVDYRTHHLRRPPSGYQWVQVDNNYALVALTSGLIASIIASGH